MRSTLILSAILSQALAHQSLSDYLKSQKDLSTLYDTLKVIPGINPQLDELKGVTALLPTNKAFESLSGPWADAIKKKDIGAITALFSYHALEATISTKDFAKTPKFVDAVDTSAKVGYQLIDGKATFLGGLLMGAKVTEADISEVDGIIAHKLDSVLTIPLNLTGTLPNLKVPTTGLQTVLNVTGQAKEFDSAKGLTFFAPNDAAFAAVQTALRQGGLEAIKKTVQYHAIEGKVLFSSDITSTKVQTVEGHELTLTVGADGSIQVDNARVVTPDIILSNGVLHIIDAVLMPGQVGKPGTAQPGSGANATGHASGPANGPAPGPPAATATPAGNATAGGNATAPGTTAPPFTGSAGKLSAAIGGMVVALGVAMMF